MLLEIALTVCLTTDLPCADINVELKSLSRETLGQAVLYTTGRTEIHINKDTFEDLSERRLRALLVHEYAHIKTYAQGEIKSHHGSAFRKNCLALAKLHNVSQATCKANIH